MPFRPRLALFAILLASLSLLTASLAFGQDAPGTSMGSDRGEVACTLTCDAGPSVSAGQPPLSVTYLSTTEASGCEGPVTYEWKIDGNVVSNAASYSVTYPSAGSSQWVFTAMAGGQSCSKTGTVSAQVWDTWFHIDGSATPLQGSPPLQVQFQASGGYPCYTYPAYQWDLGNGTQTTEESPSTTYTSPGFYKWSVKNWTSAFDDCWGPSGIWGCILVESCFKVGNLSICSDQKTKAPDSETYTFSGNVIINGMLKFSGDVTVALPSAGATIGTLTTSGTLQVQGSGVAQTLLQGNGLAFDLDGNAKTLTPKFSGAEWVATLAGLKLWNSGKPITLGDDGVTIEPTAYAGYGSLILFSFKMTILYKPGSDKKLNGAELISGQLTPGLTFMDLALNYDPPKDQLTGTIAIGFPFMGTWSMSATVRIKFNCDGNYAGINGIDMTVGFPEPVPLGTSGWEWAGFTAKEDNFCDFAHFKIFIGADLTLVGVPGEVFTLSQLGLGYNRPYLVVIEGGTATLLGYPVGSLSGRISFKPGFAGVTLKGWVNFADIYQANVSGFLSASKGTIAGNASGSIQIPDFSCSWYNVPCRTLKAAITSAVSLPVVLSAAEMDMIAGPGVSGMFRGMQKVGPVSVAVVLQYAGGDFSLLVGPNYSDVIGVGAEAADDSRAAEKSVTLASPQSQALFSVAANSESAPLPAITLRNPQGATITPSNAGGYPGVHYVGDDGLKVALFRLDEAAAGSWTLAVSNLSASEVTFQCLVPTAAPATSFTSVTPGSGSVGIQAAVNPTSADTKVSLFFSDEASGGMGQTIAENLSAASGSVSTTWATSGVTPGTYYLFARTDDGKNPPLVTYYGNPISVGGSAPLAPTNLSGSYSGTACDLQWAASPSAGVAGYRVLFTDQPSAVGYPFSLTPATGTSARVEGLSAATQYRFAVVSFDGGGSESAPSEPWYTGTPPPADLRELQSTIPVSDSVAQNAWKYYSIRVPAEPLSLEASTGAASGDVDLYLKKGSKPGTSDYDYRANGATGAEKITVTPASSPRPLSEGEWVVGVFGKQAATYSVRVTAFGGSRCAVTCSATVPPSAAPNTPVSFQGQSSTQNCTGAVDYTWTFGDKTSPVAGQNATHTFTAEGTYTWTLTALSGDAGCVQSGTLIVSSSPVCTVSCTATVPPTGSAGAPVAFAATASTTNCSASPSYAWTFGDGATSTQQDPSHTYAAAGSYPWTLTVTVPGASPCSRGGTIFVGGACTGPSITSPPLSQTVPIGQTVTLHVTATGTAPLSYQWYRGASGDTSAPVGTNSSAFTTPALTATTSFWVRVTNACNHADSAAAVLTVETGCSLSCTASATPSSGSAPLAVAFAASATPVNCSERFNAPKTVITLTSAVPIAGSVQAFGWTLYKIAVPADATQLEVKTTGTTTDLDLYVRYGAEPDSDHWDYRPYTTGGNETVTVTPSSSPRPLQGGDWYIGIYGFVDGGTFTITATVTSGGGTTTALTSGVPVPGSVEEFGWKYYSIEVPVGASQLEIKTTDATADMDLYVRLGALPDSDNWDYRPYTLEGNETVIVTTSSSPRPLQAGTWYVGVHSFWAGSYTLTATVTGGAPCTLTCLATVPSSGTAGTPVSFTSTATPSNCAGTPAFSWTFGDGATSTQQNPDHTYVSPGIYTWTLAASADGATCPKSGSITVSASGGTTYAWAFGDGSASAQQNPSHSYTSPGIYSWSMTATWNGKTCSKTGSVTAGSGGSLPGDCDGSGDVSIGEVQKAINMFLGSVAPSCGADCSADGTVSIGEVQKVINGFLGNTASC